MRFITLVFLLLVTTQSFGSDHKPTDSADPARQLAQDSLIGRQVVVEMNRLGIMVDISHVSDQAFYQVMEISQAPVIASHSSARHFTPGFERNMSDEMIIALAKNSGVIQINFGSSFLTASANEWYADLPAARKIWTEENADSDDGDHATAWQETYRQTHPIPYAKLSDVVEHIEHVVSLVGVDHVGIGSDFDGVGDSLPEGLKDVSFYPALIEELLRLEYTPEQIQAIFGGNLMRVWRAVEKHAAG